MVFNTFVWLQIFNEFNARKVNTDINVFSQVWKNWIFLLIVFFTMVGQVLIVEFGSEFTSTTPLNIVQWFSCIGIGALTIPVGPYLH